MSTLAVLGVISFKLLLDNNMGSIIVNETDVLPLARQHVDPNWISNDWYLNRPAGYRQLFDLLFGNLIVVGGFLVTSIAGRLLCFGLVALGLVFIAEELSLSLPLLLMAVLGFLDLSPHQGAAASEWLVGGLEAKAIAYGFVLFAIWLLLRQRYLWMAFALGLATSFHVLVGGWTVCATLGLLAVERSACLKDLRQLRYMGLIYLMASAFAIQPVLTQIFAPVPTSAIAPSFIYVFLRLPHHLNPLSWSSDWWHEPATYGAVLIISMVILHYAAVDKSARKAHARLFQFTLISLIPFGLGIAIAPFDSQGSFLQFYPFRLGDVLLPLHACLLAACAVQHAFLRQKQHLLRLTCTIVVSTALVIHAGSFQKQVLTLAQFPKLEPDYQALCEWVKTQTPKAAIIVTPPVDLIDFTWLTEHPTIVKYKLMPQTKADILSWYARLADLSGGNFPLPEKARKRDYRQEMMWKLTENYNHLTTKQVTALMNKYAASYFLAQSNHSLSLPIAYQNTHYILYAKPLTH